MATPEEQELLRQIREQNKKKKPPPKYIDSSGEESWVPDEYLNYLPSMIPLTEVRKGLGRIAQDIESFRPAPGSVGDIAASVLPTIPRDIQRGMAQGKITPKTAERYREGTFDYVLRLLSLPTSTAHGAVEAVMTGDTSNISKRIRGGEGLLAAGADIGKAAGEPLGIPGIGENIGWTGGLIAELFIPVAPGKATAGKIAAGTLRGVAPGSKTAGAIAKTISPRSVAAQLYAADDVIRNFDRLDGFADAATADKLIDVKNAPLSLIGDVFRTLPEEIGLGFLVPPPNVRGVLAMNAAKKLADSPDELARLGDEFLARLDIPEIRAPGIQWDRMLESIRVGNGLAGFKGMNKAAAVSRIASVIFEDLKGLDLPKYTQVTNELWVPSTSLKELTKEVKRRLARKRSSRSPDPERTLLDQNETVRTADSLKTIQPSTEQRRGILERIISQSAERLGITPIRRDQLLSKIKKLDKIKEVRELRPKLTKEQQKIIAREQRELTLATRPGQIKGSRIFEEIKGGTAGLRKAIGDPSVGIEGLGALGTRIRSDIIRGLDGINERFASMVRRNLKTMDYFQAVITSFRSASENGVFLQKTLDELQRLKVAGKEKLTKAERVTLIKTGRTSIGGEYISVLPASPQEVAEQFVRNFLDIKFGYGDNIVQALITPIRQIGGNALSMKQVNEVLNAVMKSPEVQKVVSLFAENKLREGYAELAKLAKLKNVKATIDDQMVVINSALSSDVNVNKLLTLSFIRQEMINTLTRNIMTISEDVVYATVKADDLAIINSQKSLDPSGIDDMGSVVEGAKKAVESKIGDVQASIAEALERIKNFYGADIRDIVSSVKTVDDFQRVIRESDNVDLIEALMFHPFAANTIKKQMVKEADDDLRKVLLELQDITNGDLNALAFESIRTGALPSFRGKLNPFPFIFSLAKTGLLSGVFLPNIRYHAINFLTAPTILMQTMGVSATARLMNPRLGIGIQRIVQSINNGAILGKVPGLSTADDYVVVTDRFGRKYTVDDIRNLILNNNVMASKISVEVERNIATEVLSWTRKTYPKAGKDVIRRAFRQYLGPLSGSGRGQNIWAEIANVTDLRWRTGILLDALQQGKSTDDAVALAREALFDYGSISKFERDYISKFIWFWSFRRANLVNTFKLAVTEPQLLRAGSLATRYRPEEFPGMEPEFAKNRVFVGLVENPRNRKRWALYGPSLPIVEGVQELLEITTGITAAMISLLNFDLKGAAMPAQSAFTQINPIFGGAISIFTGTKIAFGDIKPDKNVKVDPTWLYLLSQHPTAFKSFNSLVPLKEVERSKENKNAGYYLGRQWKPADKQAEINLRWIEYITLLVGTKRNISEYSRLWTSLSAGFGGEDIKGRGRVYRPPGDPTGLDSYLIGAIAEASGMVTPISLEEYRERINRHNDELRRMKRSKK